MATTTPKLHLKKPAYSDTADIQDINDNMDILDHLLTPDEIAIIVDGDAAGTAVAPGAYAYIKNNTHGLTEGLYKNKSSSAFPASGGTADSTVFEAVSGGLGSEVASLNGKINSQKITGNIGNNASKSFDYDWHNSLAVIFIGRGFGSRAGLYYVDGDGGVVTVSTCTDVTVTYSNNAFTISNSGTTVYYRIINY